MTDIDKFKGRYWHELTDEEMKALLSMKVLLGWVIENMKQPDWYTYPEALGGQMGCWSLTDCHDLRKKISRGFCKNCEGYRKEEHGEEAINDTTKQG